MRRVLSPPQQIQGQLIPPGDKSMSHRAMLLNSMAHGTGTIYNYAHGADCAATLRCLKALGADLETLPGSTSLKIAGRGIESFQEPANILNAANSGTTMRLLAGIAAGLPFRTIFTGDASLRSRPMKRVTQPLSLMGAQISGRGDQFKAPLVIHGTSLRGIEHTMAVASAQLKSALLLAGLTASGTTTLHQPALSRDHTERMLEAMGAKLTQRNNTLVLTPGPLQCVDITIPGDISSAAFFLVAAVVHPNAEIRIRNVGINPTRSGILEVLRAMGASVETENYREETGEPVADLIAKSSKLSAVEVGGDLVPRIIDELPLVALAACFAQGTTIIRDSGELRVKETDRIHSTITELRRLGARGEELPDGMVIHGPTSLTGTTCQTYRDHRMVMTLAIAGLLAKGKTIVSGAENTTVSYPGFWDDLENLLGKPVPIA